MKTGKNFLYFSVIHWDYIFQRPQHIASGLAGNNNIVLYIDPIGTVFTYLGSKFGLTRFKKHGIRGKIVKVNSHLYVYTPPKVFFPFFKNIRLINKINYFILGLFIKKIARYTGFKIDGCSLWTNFPAYVDIAGMFDHAITIYDCIDDYAYFFKSKSVRKNIDKMERDLLSLADIVFTTSNQLYVKNKEKNKNVYLIPNGVDFGHFNLSVDKESTDRLENLQKPAELRNISSPVIGYVGSISWWIDLELLSKIAAATGTTIVLIGPVDVSLNKFKNNKKMVFLGSRDYRLLPEYIKWFDICILPMKVNRLTEGVNPVKIYEYFASGKPVVCSNMEELRKFSYACFLCKSEEEFLDNVKYILVNLNEKSIKTRVARGLEIARENSWDGRIKEINKILHG